MFSAWLGVKERRLPTLHLLAAVAEDGCVKKTEVRALLREVAEQLCP